jgi:acyl-CoA dehydrogenase
MSWKLENLPFFGDEHFRLAERLQEWQQKNIDLSGQHPRSDYRRFAMEVLSRLAAAGLLEFVLPRYLSGRIATPDVRSICIIREALAYDSFLVDTLFVMQGLGTGPLWHHPDAKLRDTILDDCRAGRRIAAIALTEMSAGSDLAQVGTVAQADGDHFLLNGEKAWITNAGIADQYVVVARTGEAPGARGLSAFVVDAETPGLMVNADVAMIAPHPIGSLKFTDCRIPRTNMVGSAGSGFKAAMSTFDIFRPSVGAAAIGAARRALFESVDRVKNRHMFGKTMAEMGTVQDRIAEMAVDTEAGALMVYRAAWAADVIGGRVSRESAMSKLIATECASRVIDMAVQLFGALGVAQGSVVEQLYRDIRPTRIYEGASEVQKIVIARSILKLGS